MGFVKNPSLAQRTCSPDKQEDRNDLEDKWRAKLSRRKSLDISDPVTSPPQLPSSSHTHRDWTSA